VPLRTDAIEKTAPRSRLSQRGLVIIPVAKLTGSGITDQSLKGVSILFQPFLPSAPNVA
jgi:hypothetical protein